MSSFMPTDAKLELETGRRCQSSGNFLISGNFAQMLLYKIIGKSAFSGNLQPFQDFLTMLTGISGLCCSRERHHG